MRHDYGIVDDHITWDVVKSHFPTLKAAVVEMLAKLPEGDA